MDFVSAFQLAINGQEEGYRFLYESTCQPVYSFLLQNVSGKEEADRLIGQVYEKAWAGLGGLADPNAFPGWVQRIAEGMVLQEKNGAPTPLNANMSPDAGAGANGAMTGGSPVPGSQVGASPNMAHLSSVNAQQMTSTNVAHMANGAGQMSAGTGAAASGAGTAGSGIGAAGTGFLKTIAGKIVIGVVTATVIGTTGVIVYKKVSDNKESQSVEATTEEAYSTANILTGEETEENGSLTEASTGENTTESAEEKTEAPTEAAREPVDIPVADVPEQDAWMSFMLCFNKVSMHADYNEEYDCESALKNNYRVLEMIIGNNHCIQADQFEILDFEEADWNKTDPRGKVDGTINGWVAFASATVEGVKWVALNVLNIPEADYDILSSGFEGEYCYIENGRYYLARGGVGWECPDYQIKSAQTDGDYYYITYVEDYSRFDLDGSGEAPCYTYVAKMALKEIDGKKYWSIYSNHLVE